MIPTLDKELALRALLLEEGELIIYIDQHEEVHLISRNPISLDKEYDSVLVLTYQDLGIDPEEVLNSN